MNVSYTMPLQQSWSRMVRMLFRPFRLETWLTLGFAAFLSEYLSHAGGGGKASWRGHVHEGPAREVVRRVAEFLLHPLWGPLIIAVIALGILVALICLWISARGKFVFLDDVVHERAAIVDPWRRYGALGNSLFGFWIGFWVVTVSLIVMISLPVLPAILGALAEGGAWTKALGAIAIGWWATTLLVVGLAAACVHMFLFQIVVPIMYRHGIGVLAAWSRFFALLKENVLHFVAFALFFLVLMVGFALVVMVIGSAFCCTGFLVLSIPYVGSVILLPLEVTLRGFGPDFLAQFGSEWALTPQPAPPPSAPGA